MTKKEQFQLTFSKVRSSYGTNYYCARKIDPPNDYNELVFLSFVGSSSVDFLIAQINGALNGTNYDDEPISDAWADLDIKITSTSFIINDDMLSIPLQDMKDLLLEWKTFINS